MSKNRLFRLPIEQESESRLEATLGRMLASCQSITGRLRHRYMVARLTLSFADDHFEFERIAIAKTLDLDHAGLRHTRNMIRLMTNLMRRVTFEFVDLIPILR